MGIEDREYLRDDEGYDAYSSYGRRSGPVSIVTKIIIVTVGVFLLQLLSQNGSSGSLVENWLILNPADLFQRGQVWRLLTYAFCHDRGWLPHILMNMYGLYMIGSQLVNRTGEREFLWLYLTSAVFSGICSLAFFQLVGASRPVLGASGAVLTIYMVFAMLYPRQTFYFFGAFPIEARWLITILVAVDAVPALMELAQMSKGTGVAHSAHLGGLLFGYLYLRWNMHLSSWWDRFAGRVKGFKRSNRAKLKVYNPASQPEVDLRAQMDAILDKISQHGESSLTDRERAILNQASKQLRKNREK